MVGKLWISASIWHQAIEIWSILQAVRILLTPPETYYGMILDCDLNFYSIFSWTSSERERYLCKILLKGLFRGRFEVVFRMFGVPFRSPSTTLSVTPGNEQKRQLYFLLGLVDAIGKKIECICRRAFSAIRDKNSFASAVFLPIMWLTTDQKKKSGGDC